MRKRFFRPSPVKGEWFAPVKTRRMRTILRMSGAPRPARVVVVSVAEGAWLLGVTRGTVRLMLRHGRLATGDGTHGRHGTDGASGETARQRRGHL